MDPLPPLVSILIPCHNGARWLAAAVDSALRCIHSGEVIVVDDGSTDASAEIGRSFGSRITWLSQPAQGGNAARNRLLAAARGEWLQFLDADDYLEPEKVTRQLAEARDIANADVLYSPVWEETWRNDVVASRRASTLDASADLWTQWIRWQLPQTGGALWRAAALRNLGGWNEAMPCCQEHELYLRALQAGLRWQFCASPGAIYRLWSEETVCRKDPVRVISTRTVLIDQAVAWLKKSGSLQLAHLNAASQAFFEMARTWARYDLDAAARYLAERQQHAAVRPRGPAAPLNYRLAYHLLGFRRAETLAERLR